MKNKLIKTIVTSTFALMAVVGHSAQAQDKSAITFVVPYAPGGASDQITRTIADKAAQELKRTIVVDNKPGAAGIVAAQYVLKSKPGKTFLVGSNAPIVINEGLYSKLSYSPRTDFKAVSGLGKTPLVLEGNKKNPADTIDEFIEWAKEQTDVSMGSGGNGNITHLAGAYAAEQLGFKISHIPFNGTAPAVVNLLSGEIDIMFDTLPSSLTHLKNGDLKPYALLDEERWPTLPDVPTLKELGYPTLIASAWFGLMAPENTDDELIDTLNEAINVALKDEEVLKRLETLGAVAMPGKPKDFQAFIDNERDLWLPVIDDLGVTAD